VKKDTIAVYVVDIDAFAVFALKSERISTSYNSCSAETLKITCEKAMSRSVVSSRSG